MAVPYIGMAAAGFTLVFIMVVLGFAELLLVRAVLKRTADRRIRLAVPAVILFLGLCVAVSGGMNWILCGSFFLVLPMAVLLPVLAVPELSDPPGTALVRVLFCFLVLAALGTGVLMFSLAAGLPFVAEAAAGTSRIAVAGWYTGIAVLGLVLAFLIHRALSFLLRVRDAAGAERA